MVPAPCFSALISLSINGAVTGIAGVVQVLVDCLFILICASTAIAVSIVVVFELAVVIDVIVVTVTPVVATFVVSTVVVVVVRLIK